jgi:hypothetical protein
MHEGMYKRMEGYMGTTANFIVVVAKHEAPTHPLSPSSSSLSRSWSPRPPHH